MVAGAILAIAIAASSSYITYLVDDHFDYVATLERKVTELNHKNELCTQENLGLKSTFVEPRSK